MMDATISNVNSGQGQSFRFCSACHKDIGNVPIRSPLQKDVLVKVTAHAVSVDVLLLLSLGVIKRPKLVVSFAEETLQDHNEKWQVPW